MQEKELFKCPKCDFRTPNATDLLNHFEETERHYPGRAMELLMILVDNGRIKIEVASDGNNKTEGKT